MATYPPPYGLGSRQQKRLYKAQSRAQNAARRSQERFYQSRLKSMRRSSLLSPIVVVVAGAVLLLIRTGYLTATVMESRFNRWWPLALVLAGIILGLEWFYDRSGLTAAIPYARRGSGSGILLLVSLLFGTSAYLNIAKSEHPFRIHGFGITPDNIAEVFGEKHERDQELNLPVPNGTSLSFYNPHGDITIRGSSNDQYVHIQINKQVYSTSDAEADSKADQLSPKIVWNNGIMQLSLPSLNGSEADLSITVPETDPVTVNASNGDVHVTGMHASVDITEDRGDVEIGQLTGSVTAHLNNNDASFSANEVTGNIVLKGHAQDLSLSRITGLVSLEGDFYGDTHLEHLTGPVEFRTNRTQLMLTRLDGQVDISPDQDLIASQIVGPTILSTRSRNLSLDRVTGDLTVSNSNGMVDVTNATPLANVRIENRNGAVNLTIPSHSEFALEAQSQDGEVSNDFGLIDSKVANQDTLRGSVGDGHAHIFLSTSHAGIFLHKGEVQPPDSLSSHSIHSTGPPTKQSSKSRVHSAPPAVSL